MAAPIAERGGVAQRQGLPLRFVAVTETCHCERSEAIQSNDEPTAASRLYFSQHAKRYALCWHVGVTSDLSRRIWQHREGTLGGFTKRYDCKTLVWFELHGTMEGAIVREKQIKGGSRARKLALIQMNNPQWRDLYSDIIA